MLPGSGQLFEKTEEGPAVGAPAPAKTEQTQEIEGLQGVDLHRGGAQQVETTAAVDQTRSLAIARQQLEQQVGARRRRAQPSPTGVMGLVDDHQVPGGGGQQLGTPLASPGELGRSQ